MQFTVHLDVDAKSLFDCIVRSVAHEATEALGKEIPVKQLKKGFGYNKPMKTKAKQSLSVRVEITDFEVPRIYESKFITGRETNIMRYEIADDPQGGILVTYLEDLECHSRFDEINYKILSFLYQGRVKRHMSNLLRQMEQYILEHPSDN